MYKALSTSEKPTTFLDHLSLFLNLSISFLSSYKYILFLLYSSSWNSLLWGKVMDPKGLGKV